MPIDFPASPTTGQQYTFAGVTYTYTAQGVWASAGASGYTASATAPVSPTPGDYWYDLTTGILAIYVNDGNSSQWVQVAPGTADTTAYVRTDITQVFTPAQQSQGRGNIYAAPFEAMSYLGVQTNGAMEVSQERALGDASTPSLSYLVDGTIFDFDSSTGLVANATQVADGPPGFTRSIKISVTTGLPTLAANTTCRFLHRIEGYRLAKLSFGTANARPLSIGFWTKIHRPGKYSGTFRNRVAARSYTFNFTQNVADVWEWKTIVIPGDTTGSWEIQESAAMNVSFVMAAGSNYITPTPNAWASGNFLVTSDSINGVAAAGDSFQITGLIILPGLEIPTAAQSPFIMRPFDQELLTCLRYYETGGGVTTVNVGFGYPLFFFKVKKRAAATVSNSLSVAIAGDMINYFYQNANASDTVITWIADARL